MMMMSLERDRCFVDKHVDNIEIDGKRNLAHLELFDTATAQQLTKVLVEWSRVG